MTTRLQQNGRSTTQEILVKSDTEDARLAPNYPCRASTRTRLFLQFKPVRNTSRLHRLELGQGRRRIVDRALELTRSVRKADYAKLRGTLHHGFLLPRLRHYTQIQSVSLQGNRARIC
jgi:hypothetical protein